jgi:hypothetical protein
LIQHWFTAIEDLILAAPGNADVEAGDLWDSTLVRLGEPDAETARANRCYWDYLEADDVAPERPFFVLAEAELLWDEYNLSDLSAGGIVEVVYTEAALQDVSHRAAKLRFVSWTSALIQHVALNAKSGGVPIAAINQTVFPQRTPRKQRDRSKPDTDYFWAAWDFIVGEEASRHQLMARRGR